MNTQNDTSCLEYDDDAAIAFITRRLSDDAKQIITPDDIQYVLDVMYDYYEENNFFDEETDEVVEIVEEELLQYILKAAQKDSMNPQAFTAENVQIILDLEYDYSKSLGVY